MKPLYMYQVFRVKDDIMSNISLWTSFRKARKAALNMKLKDNEYSILGKMQIIRKY